MEPSDKSIQEIKKILEEQHGREFTWEEARKAAWDAHTLVQIAIRVGEEQYRRQKLLEKSPKGFHLDRTGYSCMICGHSASGENSWFDKYGLKCMICQKAINQRIIPGSVAKSKESWYSKYDLERHFNIKGAILNKYIRQGLLKDRIIPGEDRKIHLQLFIIKENKDMLPPKSLLKSRTVKVVKNGEEYYTQEFWYEYADVDRNKKLSKYKIVNYLQETFAIPVKSGRFYYKTINPIFDPPV